MADGMGTVTIEVKASDLKRAIDDSIGALRAELRQAIYQTAQEEANPEVAAALIRVGDRFTRALAAAEGKEAVAKAPTLIRRFPKDGTDPAA